jgi:hypothetical protein
MNLSPEAARRKETSERLMQALTNDRGINTAEGVRALVDAMYANMRDETQTRADMLTNAALYTGVASAALLDYAKLLEG